MCPRRCNMGRKPADGTGNGGQGGDLSVAGAFAASVCLSAGPRAGYPADDDRGRIGRPTAKCRLRFRNTRAPYRCKKRSNKTIESGERSMRCLARVLDAVAGRNLIASNFGLLFGFFAAFLMSFGSALSQTEVEGAFPNVSDIRTSINSNIYCHGLSSYMGVVEVSQNEYHILGSYYGDGRSGYYTPLGVARAYIYRAMSGRYFLVCSYIGDTAVTEIRHTQPQPQPQPPPEVVESPDPAMPTATVPLQRGEVIDGVLIQRHVYLAPIGYVVCSDPVISAEPSVRLRTPTEYVGDEIRVWSVRQGEDCVSE